MRRIVSSLAALIFLGASAAQAADVVKIGLAYSKTGPYFAEGLDQIRGATIAVDEINAKGGILGQRVQLAIKDTQSKTDVTKKAVSDLIEKDNVKMLLGASSSAVAAVISDLAQEKNMLYFTTLGHANSLTSTGGHRLFFRENSSAWMDARILARYLKSRFSGKKYFYITANYNWGWDSEESIRKLTGTTDKSIHRRIVTPFPGARITDFKNALMAAQAEKPDVLVLVLFGQDMVKAVNVYADLGMRASGAQVVVPFLTLAMAEAVGPQNMQGVVATSPWVYKVPRKFGYQRGMEFVEKYAQAYGRYPDTSGATAYSVIYQYKEAVERAKSFDTVKVVKALEGHSYTLLKDLQRWRDFDHQNVQTVYAVRVNTPEVVSKDQYRADFFEIIDTLPGDDAVQSREEWEAERISANKPPMLERLAGE